MKTAIVYASVHHEADLQKAVDFYEGLCKQKRYIQYGKNTRPLHMAY